MARQLFSTLVGRLRAESSFLDVQSWNPMHYTLHMPPVHVHGQAEIGGLRIRMEKDCLDLFFSVQSEAHGHRHNSTLGSSATCRDLVDQLRSLPTDEVIDVYWVPLPLWNAVTPALQAISTINKGRAIEGRRPLTDYFVMVPNLWQIDNRETQELPRRDFRHQPSYFWRQWAAHSLENSATSRYFALTTPSDNVGCKDENAILRTLGFNRTDAAHETEIQALCGATLRCCRTNLVRYRNALIGLPAGWTVVDFAALTKAEVDRGNNLHPLQRNWHYQCIANQGHAANEPSVNVCAHALRGSKVCGHTLARWLNSTVALSWQPRETGDCSEEGNTLLWQHVARAGVL